MSSLSPEAAAQLAAQNALLEAENQHLRSELGRLRGQTDPAPLQGRQGELSLRERAKVLDLAQVLVRDLDGRIVLWNSGAAQLYGFSAAEALGQVAHVLLHTTFPVSLAETEATLLREGSWTGELAHRRRDGEQIVVASQWLLYRDEQGRPASILEVNADITARKRVEQALARNERMLALFVEHAPAAIAMLDRDMTYIAVSQRYLADYKLAVPSIIGRSHYEIFPDIPEQWREIHRRCLVGAIEQADEDPFLRADGTLDWVRWAIYPWHESSGLVGGLILFSEVITERKRAELALQQATVRLRVLADVSQAFAQIGANYRAVLEQIARATTAVLGEGCLIGLLSDDLQQLVPGAVFDVDPQALELVRLVLGESQRVDERSVNARAIQTQQPALLRTIDPAQMRIAVKPEHWAMMDELGIHSAVIVPLRSQGVAIGILTLYRRVRERLPFDERDLTLAQDLADRAALAITNARLFGELEAERAQLSARVAERTADLSQANAELARAARLKDEFLANMSHELRTPLTAILGRSEVMREEIYGPVTERQQAALQSIEESGRHLLALISDILDLSKIEAGKLELEIEEVLVDSLCRESVRMVAQVALSKRIALSTTLDGAVDFIQADVRRLKQILVNLLSNAVKFTPEGGKVGLEVRGDAERQQVAFTVWDTGIGISADDLDRLFQSFTQLDSSLSRQHEGTGLGLALVRRLVEAHGGSVSVESAPGQGSRFGVTLAWVRNPDALTPPAAPAEPQQPRLPAIGRALVIEDSISTAAQLTRYLTELGATVETHPYGIGAVERALIMQPDVIILDILLPNESGWEVLRQLKAHPHTQAIPVVIVSVLREFERGQALGAVAHLVKPVLRDQLVAVLRQLQPSAERLVQSALIVVPQAEALGPLILLAEDNESSIVALQDYLPQRGYRLVVARNGAEAITQARECRPALILMDIQMPGVDGLEAIRSIRADPVVRDTPIIALTALAMPGDRERCLEAGANDYLTKPASLRTLLRVITAQLQQ